jgi:hypothetical protein
MLLRGYPQGANSRLGADYGQAIFSSRKAFADVCLQVCAGVQHGHTATPRLPKDSDQHLVAVLGNVDAFQNTGIRSMLSLGQNLSPLMVWFAKPP